MLLVFYAVFFASEALLGVSGILAVVTVGLGMGWYSCVRILVVQLFFLSRTRSYSASNYYDVITAYDDDDDDNDAFTLTLLCL